MTSSQDPDKIFCLAKHLRSYRQYKEPVSYWESKNIITNGIPNEYPDVPFNIRRDLKSSDDVIRRAMSAIAKKTSFDMESPRSTGSVIF